MKSNVVRQILLIVFAGLLNVTVRAQIPKAIEYTFVIESNTDVQINDTIQITLIADQQDVCVRGVEKTRIFSKGLKMVEQTHWQEISTTQWEKNIRAVVIGNRKNEIEITAYRKTDKGVFSLTKEIDIK